MGFDIYKAFQKCYNCKQDMIGMPRFLVSDSRKRGVFTDILLRF